MVNHQVRIGKSLGLKTGVAIIRCRRAGNSPDERNQLKQNRKVSSSVVAVLTLFLSSGCSPDVTPLQKDCESVAEALGAFDNDGAMTDIILDVEYASHVYELGDVKREELKTSLLEAYPFLPEVNTELLETVDPKIVDFEITQVFAEGYVLRKISEGATSLGVDLAGPTWETILGGETEPLFEAHDAIAYGCADVSSERIQAMFESPSWPASDFYGIISSATDDFKYALNSYQQIDACQNPELYLNRVTNCYPEEHEFQLDTETQIETRNPFTDPLGDPSMQNMAEAVWCAREGKVVNSAHSGCSDN